MKETQSVTEYLDSAPISEHIAIQPYADGRGSVKVDGQEIGGWITQGGIQVNIEPHRLTTVTVTLVARNVEVLPIA